MFYILIINVLGVKLTYVRNMGTLYAECLSNSAIFVQSRNCNHIHNFHPTTVCKISTGFSLKIFDAAKFGNVRIFYMNHILNTLFIAFIPVHTHGF